MTVFDHEVTLLRKERGALSSTAYALRSRGGDGEWSTRFARPRLHTLGELERALSATAEAQLRHLPAPIRGQLTVEAGSVDQAVGRGDAVRVRRHRRYTLTVCRGLLLGLDDGWTVAARTPWSDATDGAALGADWPVLLGPAALLAATQHLYELCALGGTTPALPPSLAVTLEPSPYPPHCRPVVEATHAAAVAGTWLRPESWSRPFGARLPVELPALALQAVDAARPPPPLLRIDSMQPLAAGPGALAWRATYTLIGSHGDVRAGVDELPLAIDVARLLDAVTGAVDAPEPALTGDAVWGESFGLAPTVATTLRAGSLRA